ncbi:IS4 family transposase [Solibacillus silvestris]|uniref:IS4 family transposase n=1 Tax=Solibacillus silvestris TaxID=76853 RepID=UPI003F81AEAA
MSQDEIVGILAEFGFEDTARKCDVPKLLNYLVDAAAFEWKSLRSASDVATEKELKFVDYSTLSKRLDELNYLIVKRIFELIAGRLNRAAKHKIKIKKELLAIDSTTITVGRNRLPWALYHEDCSGIKLHVSFTNSTGMPLQVVETISLKHDGPVGKELKDKRFILVADRAYFSIEKADRYANTNQDFIIRLKENIKLNRRKSLKRTTIEGSNIVADFTCTLGTAQNQTKKRHRVVEFTDYEGAVVRVITNLRDVTVEEIAGMYKERWAIESFFRWIEQNLPVLLGTTKNAVFSQLFAALIAYVLLKFLHTEGQKKKNCRRLSFTGFTRQLLCATLPIEWRVGLVKILAFYREIYQESAG